MMCAVGSTPEVLIMNSLRTQAGGRTFSLKSKMLCIVVLILIGFMLPRLMTYFIIDDVKIGGPLYQEIVAHQKVIILLNEVQSDMHSIRAESFNLIDESSTDKKQEISERIETIDKGIFAKFKELGVIVQNGLQKEILTTENQFRELDEDIDQKLKAYVAQNDAVAARKLLTEDQLPRFQVIIDGMAGLRAKAVTAVKAEEVGVQETIKKRIMVAGLVSLVMFAAIAACILILMGSIVRSLKRGLAVAEKVSRGDLTEKMPAGANDEMGLLAQAMNQMVDNLSGLIIRVNAAAKEVQKVSRNLTRAAQHVVTAVQTQQGELDSAHTAIGAVDQSSIRVGDGMAALATTAQETTYAILEITASIDTVADTAEQLTQAVEEVSSSILQMAASIRQVSSNVLNLVEASSVTAASIFEMDASIRQVQENATTTAHIAGDVQQDAEVGRRAMEASIVGMADIRRSSQITSEVITALSAKTGSIGDILSVIDEVAEQTNLLALNAAIIAAQAGEHGKGFAVVADEIKELAERTSSSTKEIGEVIKAVQDDTQRAVSAIAIAEQSIKDGETLSSRSGEALNKIATGVQQASDRMTQIAVATSEQSRGSQVIRDAMEQVSGMIEQIATATREQSRGGEMITQAVERMKLLTGQMKQATREQSTVGSTITAHVDKVSVMISQIRAGCSQQRQDGARIVASVETLRTTNQNNVATSDIMEQAVVTLTQQVETLQQEIAAFTVTAEHAPEPADP